MHVKGSGKVARLITFHSQTTYVTTHNKAKFARENLLYLIVAPLKFRAGAA